MNRMKESMYRFKELDLSDEQIADLLGLVYKDLDDEIEDMLATYDYRLHLLDQLDKSYKIIQENTESLINLIQQSHNLVHNGGSDEKDN